MNNNKILTFALLLLFISCTEAQNIPFSTTIKDNMVLSLTNNIVTVQTKEANHIEQYHLTKMDPINTFFLSDSLALACFNYHFNDNGKKYKYVKKIFETEGLAFPLLEISSYHISKDGDLFAFYKGNQIDEDKNNKIEDGAIVPFYGVIQIKNSKTYKHWEIPIAMFNDTFAITDKTFMRYKNGFVFTVSANTETEGRNRFLIYFEDNYPNSRFNKFEILTNTLPKYHLLKGYGYGFLDIWGRNSSLMMYSSNSILNLATGKETLLEVEQIKSLFDSPDKNLNGLQLGMTFNIDFMACDFFETEKSLKFMYRYKNELFLNVYDGVNYKLISSVKLPYTFNQLARVPLFDDKGDIYFQDKTKNELIYYHGNTTK